MTTEVDNNNNNEDYFGVISDNSSRKSYIDIDIDIDIDIEIREVLKVLESIGFRFTDYHKN
jgi:hypothetical protein